MRVFFVTGELSGDLHAAGLAEAMRRLIPGLSVAALGGPRLQAAGADLVDRIEGVGVVGLWEAVRNYARLRRLFDRVRKAIAGFRPDLLIFVDFPGFNLPLAESLQHLRPASSFFYYVSPQVWAWKYGRVRTMRRLLDGLCVLLPFEKPIYDRVGLPCGYFGHPLAKVIRPDPHHRGRAVLFMPGSRLHEVRTLLPVMVEVMRHLRRDGPDWRFLVSRAASVPKTLVDGLLPSDVRAETVEGAPYTEVSAVCAASGTATLEASLALKPTVVLYRLHPLTWLLFRLVSRIRHVSLTNILSAREVLREFVAPRIDPAAVASEVRSLVEDTRRRDRMLTALEELRAVLDLGLDPWAEAAAWFWSRHGRAAELDISSGGVL